MCECVCKSGGSWFSAPGQCPIKRKRERERDSKCVCVERRERRGAPHLGSRSGRLCSTCSQPTDRHTDSGTRTWRPPICPLLIYLLSSGCHRKPHAKIMEFPSLGLLYYLIFSPYFCLIIHPSFFLPSFLPSMFKHMLSCLCSLTNSSVVTSNRSFKERPYALKCITVFIPSSFGGGDLMEV